MTSIGTKIKPMVQWLLMNTIIMFKLNKSLQVNQLMVKCLSMITTNILQAWYKMTLGQANLGPQSHNRNKKKTISIWYGIELAIA